MGAAKILIVDDELIMRESLAGWLKRDGHEVETVPSGEKPFNCLKRPVLTSCWWISKWKG